MSRPIPAKRKTSKPRQVRDAEATKAQILDAAEEEFARHGLNGARTEAIATRSGVTKAMIYYYFESKEGLYREVLQRPAIEMHQMFGELNLDELSAEEALKSLISAAIAYEANHPQRGMLWFQEANQNEGKYFKQGNWQENFAYIIKVLEKGITEGCFRKLDPLLTSIQIASVCTLYFNAHKNLQHLAPDLQLLSDEMIEKYTQEAINFIIAGVKN
ncbi:TetR family transcriptional regulator [Aerosakkonemataceae cyanobacterium BLCC-F154]|uniref:TetR family transcriptional regulator n=1 Tax=Floridaenema fluviatile BLCC-F154 TaxID=3153640 RepID=A0ABV4YGL4_9CYAN